MDFQINKKLAETTDQLSINLNELKECKENLDNVYEKFKNIIQEENLSNINLKATEKIKDNNNLNFNDEQTISSVDKEDNKKNESFISNTNKSIKK